MAPGKNEEEPIPAKLTDLDPDLDPVPAEIVSDKRYSLGKRLGYLALALLALFFVISGYIQSAKNGSAVRDAARHDSKKTEKLLDDVHNLSKSSAFQTRLIKQLQQAIRAQNRELRKAGLATISVPGESPSESSSGSGNNRSDNPKPKPKPSQSSHPKPHPTKTPHPPPGPIDKAKNTICSLTGICISSFWHFFIF